MHHALEFEAAHARQLDVEQNTTGPASGCSPEVGLGRSVAGTYVACGRQKHFQGGTEAGIVIDDDAARRVALLLLSFVLAIIVFTAPASTSETGNNDR
ncbi:hypothetical protein SALB1_0280 [Salinisphaera sp. LB1]|nr:hypothetical protein SALB1_0280 [Salinisphaera sp. LB1]